MCWQWVQVAEEAGGHDPARLVREPPEALRLRQRHRVQQVEAGCRADGAEEGGGRFHEAHGVANQAKGAPVLTKYEGGSCNFNPCCEDNVGQTQCRAKKVLKKGIKVYFPKNFNEKLQYFPFYISTFFLSLLVMEVI